MRWPAASGPGDRACSRRPFFGSCEHTTVDRKYKHTIRQQLKSVLNRHRVPHALGMVEHQHAQLLVPVASQKQGGSAVANQRGVRACFSSLREKYQRSSLWDRHCRRSACYPITDSMSFEVEVQWSAITLDIAARLSPVDRIRRLDAVERLPTQITPRIDGGLGWSCSVSM